MEIIQLANKKQIEVVINGKECIISLALKNISHFQEGNKVALPVALEKMQQGDLEMILKLIYSMVSDKNNGKVLGEKFFRDFDELGIIEALTPSIMELIQKDMPTAKSENERKK